MSEAENFIANLAALSFDCVFNPYSNRCPIHDRADAPKVRRRMLLGMLEAATQCEVDSLWIGRDLGYRGGRRTGLALTDDIHMRNHADRWGVDHLRSTKGLPVAERTASVIWSVLDEVAAPIFLWNVFPLHPHERDNPFSNRSHNAKERQTGEEVLESLIRLISPRRVVAIGNDAAASLLRIEARATVLQVRHPSYGGQADFLRQMREIYSVRAGLLL